MKRQQKGFSLIELLIVVSVILVISAIAIPAAISSSQSGNEGATVGNLRALVTANAAYEKLYGVGYAASPTNLSMAYTGCPNTPDSAATAGACLMATGMSTVMSGTGAAAGYQYAYTPSSTTVGTAAAPVASWNMVATPTASLKGRRNYCADFTGAIVWAWAANTLTPQSNGTCPAVSSTVFALGS